MFVKTSTKCELGGDSGEKCVFFLKRKATFERISAAYDKSLEARQQRGSAKLSDELRRHRGDILASHLIVIFINNYTHSDTPLIRDQLSE